MKAILIARVSTEEQKEASNSLPAQVSRLKNYCESRTEIIHTCTFDENALLPSTVISSNPETFGLTSMPIPRSRALDYEHE